MDSNSSVTSKLETINELVTALSEGERTDFSKIIHSTNISKNQFEEYCSWSEECYTRNCIAENNEFELILLCWEEGQITPIHDHGGEECWVKIVDGEFKEVIYKEDATGEMEIIKSSIAKSGHITYMIDFMGFHSLENQSKKRSMSLHLYAKPIRSCNLFDEESGKIIHKELMYDTVA